MIPVNTPVFGEQEKAYVNQCLNTGWVATGEFVADFEHAWASYCGCKHGIAVTNGTHALELAIAALDFPTNSEIIIPSFTIISCALAAIRNNLKPVLVDANSEDWCIDTTKIADAITTKTVAIMPVHIYGHPANMADILDIATKHNLIIIEDAAEAHGASCYVDKRWQKCGSIGHVGCFSFYGNKIITTGEGGMVITNDQDLAKRMRSIRNLCFGEGNNRFVHDRLAHNFRMTNIQAAIGLGQLERIDKIITKKRDIARYYNQKLSYCQTYQLPPRTNISNVYWMYGLVSKDLDRPAAHFIHELYKLGIDSRPFFTGLHQQPALNIPDTPFRQHSFPITEYLAKYGFYIPSGIDLRFDQLQTVTDALLELA